MALALFTLSITLYLVLRMRRQSARLKAMMDVLPVGVVIQDSNGKICEANAMAERMLGLTRAQLLASEALDPQWQVVCAEGLTLAPGDCPSMQTVLTGVALRDVLIGVAHGNAKKRWLRINTERIPMARGGAPGVVSSFVDVTEVSAQRRMLQLAVEGALLGTWDWHLPDGQVNYNDQWWQMLGYEPFPNPSSVDEWAALVHPDDLVEARHALAQHFDDPSMPYRCDLRMLRRDGEWAWILTAGTVVERNAQGEVIRMAGVHMDISARKHLERALDSAATNDPLTGLLNREGLQQKFVRSGERQHGAMPAGYAVILLGFDRFKAIVDSLGLSAGDELLRHIAQRLRETLAQENERTPGARITTPAHMERDKFAVLLEPMGGSADAVAFAERVLCQLSQPYAVLGHSVKGSLSVGVVANSDGELPLDVTLRNADIAMREAKRLGRSRCVLFTSDMQERVRRAVDMEEELRAALGGTAEIYVAYQPIIELCSGRTVGAEALARWQHPERGAISPVEFIPIAEQTGLILELGERVLRSACADMVVWQQQYGANAPLTVSVNLSRIQIAQGTLPQLVADVLRETGLSAANLRLEITESLAMLEETVFVTLSSLRTLGVSLALDDFGTGYSSLASLDQMPLDVLKMDRSFVQRMATNAYQASLVEATLRVSASLKLKVVAEGVEDPTQAQVLRDLGCDYAQGYLYGKPVVASELPRHFMQTKPL